MLHLQLLRFHILHPVTLFSIVTTIPVVTGSQKQLSLTIMMEQNKIVIVKYLALLPLQLEVRE